MRKQWIAAACILLSIGSMMTSMAAEEKQPKVSGAQQPEVSGAQQPEVSGTQQAAVSD